VTGTFSAGSCSDMRGLLCRYISGPAPAPKPIEVNWCITYAPAEER